MVPLRPSSLPSRLRFSIPGKYLFIKIPTNQFINLNQIHVMNLIIFIQRSKEPYSVCCTGSGLPCWILLQTFCCHQVRFYTTYLWCQHSKSSWWKTILMDAFIDRFESIIHEFDPWFNYRSTAYMVRPQFSAIEHWTFWTNLWNRHSAANNSRWSTASMTSSIGSTVELGIPLAGYHHHPLKSLYKH